MIAIKDLSTEDLQRERTCANCGKSYAILHTSKQHFEPPYDYTRGCVTNCITCWLGCGPQQDGIEGNLLRELGLHLSSDTHMVVMPLTRVQIVEPIRFLSHAIIYPPGMARMKELNIAEPSDTSSLAEFCSAVSGVDRTVLEQHAILAFPYRFDWDAVLSASHANHMEVIRRLSDAADDVCLNLLRFHLCRLDLPDTLPGRAGQIKSNHMMAGALLYNAGRSTGQIIAGDAFALIITKGLGLEIDHNPIEYFPGDGEVGSIVRYALSLHSALLELDNPTAKFAQALALLEFLAEPFKYIKFQDVKKVIGRYAAKDRTEYERLMQRFMELTSKTDDETGEQIGYRTQIMHIGGRLENIVPEFQKRRDLFRELDRYIGVVIDHMLRHSEFSWEDYLGVRAKLEPYNY
jgi:hypothetical protein